MEALQYIYTSWKNGDSTEKGYMIYSRSEGITELECSTIKDAMKYHTPIGLTFTPTPQEIADLFPYAFSYFVLPTGRGCVAQSTYLGKDYSGRYGNYIIHALIFDINDLPCRPAEFFAEPYIKTAMTQEELDAPSPVPPLPSLKITEYGSAINDEQLNEFLFDKKDEFAQLISMILEARDKGVPFYLNDSRENLVLWSAAVQRMLPSRLATKFTFNTYIGDHESMRSLRAREEGLNFHLIGVRPDANHFNYATESMSNRQIVMDFIGGHMTQGVTPKSYAKAMAQSMAFDCEEVDSFGEFVDATSFNEINGHLQDAYLYYHLLRNNEFEFTENNLQAVLSFGSTYCSEVDNSDVGYNLLIKCREGGWKLEAELFVLLWGFVCKYSSFMIFTLYELFTETIYQHAGEASEPCTKLDLLIQTIKDKTPQQYDKYLSYLNSSDGAESLFSHISGHSNPFTNSFYITWLLQSYTFDGGMSNDQPISKVLQALLKNITKINGCEKQMIEILIAASDNQALFENVLSVFMTALRGPRQLEQLCDKYVEVTESLTDRQLNRFEFLLLETPEASPIATRLFARKIGSSKNPEEEFWRFYNNKYSRIDVNPEFTIEPLILACVDNVGVRNKGDVAIDILHKIDATLINDSETIRILTDVVNACSVKLLSKIDSAFLERVCEIRAKVGEDGLEKIKAIRIGEVLANNNAQRKHLVNLSDALKQGDINLQSLDKSDYETYTKTYLDEYLVLVQTAEDVHTLMKFFYNSNYFLNFADDYIAMLKKMKKGENDKWKRVVGWTCIYLVIADGMDQVAEEMFKPIVRYMRSFSEDELIDVRQIMVESVPGSRCDFLFDEVRRKESMSEKMDYHFRKIKNNILGGLRK